LTDVHRLPHGSENEAPDTPVSSDGTITRVLGEKPQQFRHEALLLIDIDGVISLWGWPDHERPDGAWTLVDGIPHFLSRAAADRVRELAEVYEPLWCSGWEDRANEHLPALVGLGPFPHLAFGAPPAGPAGPGHHWKLAAIDAHAGPDRPVAWIDDALTPACHAWAAARRGPTLLVETDPAEGLTAAQAARLRAWDRVR
jgi:hypothetical protein